MIAQPQQDIFGLPLDELEKFSRGEQLGAGKMNRLVDTVNRNSAQIRPPSQVIRPTTPIVQLFSVRSVRRDYLLCRTWDGSDIGSEDIKVLKPWMLRKTPFHNTTAGRLGITYEYGQASDAQDRVATRTSDDETEDQVVVPLYDGGTSPPNADIIFGMTNVLGGLDDNLETFAEGATFIDMNFDGRQWAKATT